MIIVTKVIAKLNTITGNNVSSLGAEGTVRTEDIYTSVRVAKKAQYKQNTDKYTVIMYLYIHALTEDAIITLHPLVVALFDETSLTDTDIKTYQVSVLENNLESTYDGMHFESIIPIKIAYKEL